MKNTILFLLLISIVFALLFSCSKKSDNYPQVPPVSADTNAYVMWTVSGVQQTNKQLYALVTVTDNSGMPIITNKKLTLDEIQGTYKTDKLLLPKGSYKLSKFIVVQATDTAAYAVPLANTAKAPQVTRPLPADFSIAQFGINGHGLAVLKVNSTDRPDQFGYTDADFGFLSWTNLDVKLKINVGQVAYDGLPGTLHVDAVNNDGGHWLREIELQKGTTHIRVPRQYVTYTFKVHKWNTTAEKVLNQQEIKAGMMLNLEGNRQPKRLVEEATFLQNNLSYIPESRSEYFYGANGLLEIKTYQKSLIVSGLPLTNIYRFIYTGGVLNTINRYDAANTFNGYTAFEYQAGRISTMSNKSYDVHTGAAVSYIAANDHEVITVDYLFHNGNTMHYSMLMSNGNKISDDASTSTGGSENGIYEYDNNINPRYALGYPDLYFSNHSKNNLTLEIKNYAGAVPSVVPYKTEYVYDNDGYPTEVYISYKGFTSQQHLYRTKTTFTYQ